MRLSRVLTNIPGDSHAGGWRPHFERKLACRLIIPSLSLKGPAAVCLLNLHSYSPLLESDPTVSLPGFLHGTLHHVLKLAPKVVRGRPCARVFLAEAVHEECFDLLKSVIILYRVMNKKRREKKRDNRTNYALTGNRCPWHVGSAENGGVMERPWTSLLGRVAQWVQRKYGSGYKEPGCLFEGLMRLHKFH